MESLTASVRPDSRNIESIHWCISLYKSAEKKTSSHKVNSRILKEDSIHDLSYTGIFWSKC